LERRLAADRRVLDRLSREGALDEHGLALAAGDAAAFPVEGLDPRLRHGAPYFSRARNSRQCGASQRDSVARTSSTSSRYFCGWHAPRRSWKRWNTRYVLTASVSQ